jgi:hypothetical protein
LYFGSPVHIGTMTFGRVGMTRAVLGRTRQISFIDGALGDEAQSGYLFEQVLVLLQAIIEYFSCFFRIHESCPHPYPTVFCGRVYDPSRGELMKANRWCNN